MQFEKMQRYAPVVLRIGISLVFLWFGASQLLNPQDWVGWVPGFVSAIMNPSTVILLNGIFEVSFSILLILGFYTRIASLLLAVHLLGITATIGFNEIGVRDFGLSLATLSIFLNGPDFLCIDSRKNRK